jgi:sec-independent protein translocase protein TatA
MFGSLGFTELILILFIVLIIFGAGKLPQLGEGIGKAIKGFKKSVHEADAIEAEAQAQAQAQQAEPLQAQAIAPTPATPMATPVLSNRSPQRHRPRGRIAFDLPHLSSA